MLANGVVNNEAESRYELAVNGHVAIADYRIEGNRIIFPHTFVPREMGGRGVGGRLVNAALDDAEARGLEIVPACSFVRRAVAARAKRKGA